MPRTLVFSNGNFLLAYDAQYRLRELCYPQLGVFNHLAGLSIRTGIWVDGMFSWIEADDWHRSFTYRKGTLVAECVLNHEGMGVRLETVEAMHPTEPAFVRQYRISCSRPGQHDVRLFFYQDLHIAESDIGDTAFYHPGSDSVIQFKGHHAFLFGGKDDSGGLYQHSTGGKRYEGLEGTWRDCEDGVLEEYAISQGMVDCAFSLRQVIEEKPAHVTAWIVAGSSIPDVTERYAAISALGAEGVADLDRARHTGMVERVKEHVDGLPPELLDFCVQSAVLIQTQVDARGGFIAATDSDVMVTNRANYSYVWMRDGANIAQILDDIGETETSGAFFQFCLPLIRTDQPFFLQKYRSDGTLGATWHPWQIDGKPILPIQEDETASVITALKNHLSDIDRMTAGSQEYGAFARMMIQFMIDYRDKNGLPQPSYDLWEERRGIHAFTVGTVIRGLRDGADLLEAWGEDPAPARKAADETEAALRKYFPVGPNGVYVRMLTPNDSGYTPDLTPDASLLLLRLFGGVPMDDDAAIATEKWVFDQCGLKGGIGGISRYPGDWYWRQGVQYPGNPWPICTLWRAQLALLDAKEQADFDRALDDLHWCWERADSTCVLAEQYHPDTGAPLSVSPLTWSHVEVLRTALMWGDAKRRLKL